MDMSAAIESSTEKPSGQAYALATSEGGPEIPSAVPSSHNSARSIVLQDSSECTVVSPSSACSPRCCQVQQDFSPRSRLDTVDKAPNACVPDSGGQKKAFDSVRAAVSGLAFVAHLEEGSMVRQLNHIESEVEPSVDHDNEHKRSSRSSERQHVSMAAALMRRQRDITCEGSESDLETETLEKPKFVRQRPFTARRMAERSEILRTFRASTAATQSNGASAVASSARHIYFQKVVLEPGVPAPRTPKSRADVGRVQHMVQAELERLLLWLCRGSDAARIARRPVRVVCTFDAVQADQNAPLHAVVEYESAAAAQAALNACRMHSDVGGVMPHKCRLSWSYCGLAWEPEVFCHRDAPLTSRLQRNDKRAQCGWAPRPSRREPSSSPSDSARVKSARGSFLDGVPGFRRLLPGVVDALSRGESGPVRKPRRTMEAKHFSDLRD